MPERVRPSDRTAAVAEATEAHARAWLAWACPNLWGLLSPRAKCALPVGLVSYLTTGDAEAMKAGRRNLTLVDGDVAALIRAAGHKKVGDAFRRDLSKVTTEAQLAQHLCELSTAAALCRLAGTIILHPRTERGTSSDFAVEFAAMRVYGEVKRFEDTFPLDGEGAWRVRSLVKLPPGVPIPLDVERPRSMDLVSKVENAPKQFPSSPIVDAMAYGVRRTPSSRARPVRSSFTTQASPEHVGVYPVPITMPTSGSFFFTASSSAVRAPLRQPGARSSARSTRPPRGPHRAARSRPRRPGAPSRCRRASCLLSGSRSNARK